MSIHAIKQELEDKAQARNANLVGELLWWSMEGVEVLSNDVEEIINRLGITDPVTGKDITAQDVCPKLQDRGGLMKALGELGIRARAGRRKTKSSSSTTDRVLIPRRLTGADDKTLGSGFSVALIDEELSSNNGAGMGLDWNEVQRITYSADTRQLSFTTELFKAEISRGFIKYAQTYRAAEMSRVIGNLIERAQGVLARASGGVYFVPAPRVALVESIDGLCAKVMGADLDRWPVFDTGDETSRRQKKQTMEFAGRALRKELQALKDEMVELQAQAADPDGASLRGSTVTKRIDAYKVLRQKAKTYRELLGLADEKMKGELNALARSAKALVHGAPSQ